MIRSVRSVASGLLIAGVVLLTPALAQAETAVPVITDISVQNGNDIAIAFTNDVADVVSVDVVLFDESGNIVATDSVETTATADVFTSVAAGAGYTVQVVDHTSGDDVVSQLSDSVAIPVVDPMPYSLGVDPSTATVSLNGDASGWTISFVSPVDYAGAAAFVVSTADGSSCTAYGDAASQGSTVSCDVPLLTDPNEQPVVTSIDYVLMPINYYHEPISVDVTTAIIVLNDDGSGWTVSFPEPAGATEGMPFVVTSQDGADSCFATATGVEGATISCDLNLLEDPTVQPTISSISSIQVMYYARGGVGNGGIGNGGVTTSTIPGITPIEAYASGPQVRDKSVTLTAPKTVASHPSVLGMILGLVAMLILSIGMGWARWRRPAHLQHLR